MPSGDITSIVGVGTLIIGVFSFIIAELDKRHRAVTALLQNWQGDTITYIVDESGEDGLRFAEIKVKYITSAAQYRRTRFFGGSITPDMLQDAAIRRILSDLQSKGILDRTDDDKYIIQRREPAAITQRRAESRFDAFVEMQRQQMAEMQRAMGEYLDMTRSVLAEQGIAKIYIAAQREILRIIAGAPYKLDAEAIVRKTIDRTKADSTIVMLQFMALLEKGILTRDADGKVSGALLTMSPPASRLLP